MAGLQSRLDRIIPSGGKQSRLDRIPGGSTAVAEPPIAPAGPVMAGGRAVEPRSDIEGGTLSQMGHGAIESFMKLPELEMRLQSALPREVSRRLARIIPSTKPAMDAFEGMLPKPGMSEMAAQAVLPITEAEHGTVASQIGQVAGGLAQVPILGPAGIPGMAAGFGGQSYMGGYDEAKANGASEFDAHVAGATQGGITALTVAATAGLATRFNVNSGGIWAKLAKNAALGVGTGMTEQTFQNLATRYTALKDRELFTGLKGRAATDAAVGLLMATLFPGHKPSKRVAEAVARVKVAEPLAPKAPEPIPGAAQLVGVEGIGAKQAEPVDPFMAKVAELQGVSTRMDELAAQSKDVRQKGRPQDSTPIDTERIGLLKRQQEIALEMQGIAAERRAPQEVQAEQVKKPWEMSLDEVTAAEAEAKGGDKALLIKLFGEEGAKKYDRAYRRENSSDHKVADAAFAEREAMEATLSESQRNRLFGIGDETPGHETLAEYRKAMEGVDVESPVEMGKSLRWAFSELGGVESPDPAQMTEKQRVRFAQVKHALGVAAENGWDQKAVVDEGMKAAIGRFPDSEDALFMLRKFLPGQGGDAASKRIAAPEPLTHEQELTKALGDPHYRESLSIMAAEAGGSAPGGRPSTDPITGERIHNYAAANAEWWDARPGGMSKDEVQRLVARLVKAPEGTVPKLTPRQLDMLEYMLHNTAGPRQAMRQAEADIIRGFSDAPPADADAGIGDTSFDPSTWEADLHAAIEEITGDPKTAAEEVAKAKAASDLVGEPPGPPKPPTPVEEIPGPGDTEGRKFIDDWVGRKRLVDYHADIRGNRIRKDIDRAITRGALRAVGEKFGPRDERARQRVEHALQLDIDTLGKIDEQYAKYGSQLTDEHKAVLRRAAELPPSIRLIRDRLIADNLGISKGALTDKLIPRYFEVFTKRFWKGVSGEDEAPQRRPSGKPKFATFTTGALARVRESILEGWAKGDELLVKSAVDASVENEKILGHVRNDQDFIEQGVKTDFFREFNPGEGWDQIQHPNFKNEKLLFKIDAPESAEIVREKLAGGLGVDVPIDEAVKVYGRAKEGKASIVFDRGMRIYPRGDDILVFQDVPLFAKAKDARIINNILGASWFKQYAEKGGIGPGLVKMGDNFGIITRTLQTASIQDNLAFLALRNFLMSPAKTPLDILTLKPYFSGKRLVELSGPDIEGGVQHGLQLRPQADIAPFLEMREGKLAKAVDKIPLVGNGRQFLLNTYRDMNLFLYGKVAPAYGAHVYTLELGRLRKFYHEKLMRGEIADRELMRAAGAVANKVTASVDWQRMGVDPTILHIAQTGLYAPTRIASSLGLATDAIPIRAGANLARHPSRGALKQFIEAWNVGAKQKAHQALWARMASRYVFMWAAMNFASAYADDPDHPLDAFLKSARSRANLGWRYFLSADLDPILARVGRNNPAHLYVNMTAQALEPAEVLEEPGKYEKRKLGVLPQAMSEFWSGEDYLGRRYTTVTEGLGLDDRGIYRTTRLPHHVAGMPKPGHTFGQLTSYTSEAAPGAIGWSQVPSFAASRIPLPFEVENWVNVLRGNMDAWDAAIQTFGIRTIHASLKRQEAAGVDVQTPGYNHMKELRSRYLRAAELGAQ